MMYRYVSLLTLLFVGLSVVRAQQTVFLSNTLKDIAKGINYIPNDSCTTGIYDIGYKFGMPVYVEYNDNHIVTNIGVKLFPQEIQKSYSSNVYKFIERYFLELYTWHGKNIIQQKIHDDKFMFTHGTISDIRKINENTIVSVSRTDDKFYEVTWSNETEPSFLSIAFPIQYELILGMTQAEIEKTIYDVIVSVPENIDSNIPENLEQVKNHIYRTSPSKYYQQNSLNTDVFYYKDGKKTTLVLDTLNLDLSVTNIWHISSQCNNPISVEQNIYGFNKKDYIITLHQWLNYCKYAGLVVYTAIEEESKNAFKILVLAENKDLGYNHILSVVVPRNFLAESNAIFQAKLNAFIPTHNVKDLYKQYTKTNKRIFK